MEKWLSLDSKQGIYKMSYEYMAEPESKETLKTCTCIYILTNTPHRATKKCSNQLKEPPMDKPGKNMAFITQVA